jgi:hypothetical protein
MLSQFTESFFAIGCQTRPVSLGHGEGGALFTTARCGSWLSEAALQLTAPAVASRVPYSDAQLYIDTNHNINPSNKHQRCQHERYEYAKIVRNQQTIKNPSKHS